MVKIKSKLKHKKCEVCGKTCRDHLICNTIIIGHGYYDEDGLKISKRGMEKYSKYIENNKKRNE